MFLFVSNSLSPHLAHSSTTFQAPLSFMKKKPSTLLGSLGQLESRLGQMFSELTLCFEKTIPFPGGLTCLWGTVFLLADLEL